MFQSSMCSGTQFKCVFLYMSSICMVQFYHWATKATDTRIKQRKNTISIRSKDKCSILYENREYVTKNNQYNY